MCDKIIILGDMHIGARSASTVVMEHQLKFYEDQLFPYMEKNGIKTILQLGDLLDTRKFSNHLILHSWRERFFSYMENHNISFITLLGNHDIFFRNTLDVNSVSLFVGHHDNVTIVDAPTDMLIGKTAFSIIPWVCDGNLKAVEDHLEATTSPYCAGHFEFNGFEINPGIMCTDGMDAGMVKQFDAVFSGHFHTRGSKGNITYIGIPTEMTWIDYNDPKGFTVFDTSNGDSEFIQNPVRLFKKIVYHDKDQGDSYYKTIDNDVTDCYVKVIATSKTDPYQFDKFVTLLISKNPIDLKIIDEFDTTIDTGFENVDVEAVDTTVLMDMFVDQLDTELSKDRIKAMLKKLYVEAVNV